MSIRIDTFRDNGDHESAIFTDVTGEMVFQFTVDSLRNGKFATWAEYMVESPITTVVKAHVNEEPWF